MAKVRRVKAKKLQKNPSREKNFSLDCFLSKILEYKWLVVFFVFFFIFQVFYISFVHWDKVAYVFAGKWFCGNQIYLELIRPPLPSALNCAFGGADFSILITTAFAAILYFAAVLLIYFKNKGLLHQPLYALFAFLFPAILFNSNFGSDLLALAFILLALAVKSPLKKGIFFALATLSRYNALLFGFVLLWEQRKEPKNIPLILLPVVLFWVPWMIFNYLYTGNPLFSIYESSFLNVAQKGLAAPFTIDQIALLLIFVISFVLAGFLKSLNDSKNQSGIISFVMFIISGIKEMRFANLLTPVIAFNAAISARKNFRVFLLFIGIFAFFVIIGPKPYFVASVDIPTDSFIRDCRVASDKWVFFYDHNIVAECSADIGSYKAFVESGGSIVLYDYDLADYSDFNVIKRDNYIILKSDLCAPQPKKYISGSFRNYVVKWLKDTNSKVYDYSDWVE
jgi:hypothetical protein